MKELPQKNPAEIVENSSITASRFPGFEQTFVANDRNFTTAAINWATSRLDALYIPDPLRADISDTLAHEVMVRFNGEAIRTDVFPQIMDILQKSQAFMLWTSGNTEVQTAKTNAVRGCMPDAVVQRELPPIIAANKLKQTPKASHAILKAGLDQKQKPTIMVIDDKISNMFKLLGQYSDLPESIATALHDEENIDSMNEKDFKTLLMEVSRYARANRKIIAGFSHVYVPPDKPVGESRILEVSPLRAARVTQLMRSVNGAFFSGPLPFMHRNPFIDSRDTERVQQDMPSHYVALVDVDGVLVSQTKVLATREQELKNSLREQMVTAYKNAFAMSPQEFLEFLQYGNNTQITTVNGGEMHINKYSRLSPEGTPVFDLSITYPHTGKIKKLQINNIDPTTIKAAFGDLDLYNQHGLF